MGDQINWNEQGMWHTHKVAQSNCIQGMMENVTEWNHIKDLDADGRIILKWILKERRWEGLD